MRIVIALLGITLLAIVGCAATQTSGGKKTASSPFTDSDNARLVEISKIGQRLYQKDYFGAVGTDLLMQNINPSDHPNFAGWLVKDEGETFTVSFFEQEANRVIVLADIVYAKGQEPSFTLKPERSVDPVELKMFRARQLGLQIGANDCSDRFNTVVLPLPNGRFDVYVLAATTDPDAIVIGGHSRITVSADGEKVLSKEAYSTSCIALDKTPKGIPEGAKVTNHFVTHVVDPLPAPTHVFAAMLHDTTLYVVTEKGIFAVGKGTIQFIKNPE